MTAHPQSLGRRTALIDLVSFNSRAVADLVRTRLTGAGIENRLHDERDLQRFVFLTEAKANIKIQVAETEYAAATKQLIEFEQEQPAYARHIFSCPECGSFAVEYPQFTRKFFTPLLIEWLFSIGLFPKQCYCRKCHFTWSRSRVGGFNSQHYYPSRSVFIPPSA